MKRILALLLALVLVVPLAIPRAQAATGGKLIALTFDDGPDYYDTAALLDGLKEKQVKATFFMLGENAQRYPSLVARAYAEGHEIGSHSWDHPDLTGLTAGQVREQIQKSVAVLEEILGPGQQYLVRPPYGSTNDQVRQNIDYPLIHWSVDTLDWESLDAKAVRSAILNDAYDGAIVLLHDIHSTSVEGVLMAIDALKAQGYEFVTVSELFRRRGTALENGTRYYHQKPTGVDLGAIPAPQIRYTVEGETMTVTITADTDAPIYYTTDGTVPRADSPVYTQPLTLAYPCDVRAVAAWQMNGSRSDMAVLSPGKTPCDAPQMQVTDMTLSLSHENEDVGLYYTLDDTPATLNSTRYTEPVTIPGGHYIRAVAGGGFYRQSEGLRLYCSERGVLYADVKPTDWYYSSIDRLAAQGLMSGVGRHRFAPGSRLTRGMLVTLLYACSAEQLEEGWSQQSPFTDVPAEQYYAASVEWAWRGGLVSGYDADSFGPNGNITRQELCVIIDRYLAYRGVPLPRGESCVGKFQDYGRIQSWARSSVEALTAAGMIAGAEGRMNPTGSATRAEVATVLCRVLDYEIGETR